ncbi:MAG: DUF58 domain-containing protein [Candidatus Limnocylindrales bacterium]|jgi:uncharacterized protein (DUF58 family)
MTRAGLAFGLVLVAAGIGLAAPGLVLVGLLDLFAVGVTELWSRFGLRDLHYERRIGRERAVWGDEVPLDIGVWNDKPLPLAWLSIDDFATQGAVVREESLLPSERPGFTVLRSRWTVGWYERVVRHLTIVADHRGVYSFGPVRVTVADLFGHGAATQEHGDRGPYVVRPRSLPVRFGSRQHAPAGYSRARQGLFEDPALFAGVRPYQPGDPMRRVHWRATARTGSTVSKRFDPSRALEVLVALDVQTIPGPHWTLHFDEELVEGLMVAAASLARHALAEGASCGLAAAAFNRTLNRFAIVPPRAGRDQLASIADMLARLSETPSAPFEHLLARLPQTISPGTTVIVLTARDPEPYMAVLAGLDRSGYNVELVGLGPNGDRAVAQARAAGLRGTIGSLTPDWRTSDALVLAS